MARETIEHFLRDCPLHQKERDEMDSQIQEIWFNNAFPGNLSISKELLLSAKGSSNISSDINIQIKKALFEFIESTGKLL